MCGCQTHFSAPMIGTVPSGKVDICTMSLLQRTGGPSTTGLIPLSIPSTRRGCVVMTLSTVMLSLIGGTRPMVTAGLSFVRTKLMSATETGDGLGGTEMTNPGQG